MLNRVKNRDEGHGDQPLRRQPKRPKGSILSRVPFIARHLTEDWPISSSPLSPETDGNISHAFEDYHLARGGVFQARSRRPQSELRACKQDFAFGLQVIKALNAIR